MTAIPKQIKDEVQKIVERVKAIEFTESMDGDAPKVTLSPPDAVEKIEQLFSDAVVTRLILRDRHNVKVVNLPFIGGMGNEPATSSVRSLAAIANLLGILDVTLVIQSNEKSKKK